MHKDAMKRLFGSILALATLLALLPSCDQPKASCTAGVGPFAVKYTLKKMGGGACDNLKGEIIGLAKYNPLKEGEKTIQDLTKAYLVIRTSKLGDLSLAPGAPSVDAADIVSTGDFDSTTPDDDDVCSVPELSPAEFNQDPDTHIKYEWSKIRLLVTTAYPGTQMVGELTYTEGNCTASYSVIGLWPGVSCEGKNEDDMPSGVADQARCDPKADPASGRATGSGINPDLEKRVTCDNELLLCVLTEPPPSLK
jgi:hypothetical protein